MRRAGSSLDWVRVPIGEEAASYISVHFERSVLVVARSVTTASWLLDFLPELLCDSRVQVLFTVEDESPSVYDRGAHELLGQMGVAQIPWSQATARKFDLAICATHRGSLRRLKAPLIITPHGPGYGKPGSVSPGQDIPIPQVTTARPATTMVLSHPEQAHLFEGHPPEVRLLVAGDPAYDRLQASSAARSLHRRAFGVTGGRRLVVLSSTWGPGAQFGRYPDLSVQLARELPVDQYGLAMIIHPNIWYGHSRWQVRTWLRRAREAGVTLVEPFGDEWRSAVLAADLVIMDHGSVGFYAAAVGTPVLLASFGHEYLIDTSPLAELGRVAPDLDLGEPLKPQIERVLAKHEPQRYSAIADRMFAVPGRSHEIMAKAVYELIELDQPEVPPRVLGVKRPTPALESSASHVVFAESGSSANEELVVSLSRFPAAIDDSSLKPVGGGGRHLVVDQFEGDPRLLESAAVITCKDQDFGPADCGVAWARDVLDAYPGCRMAAILNSESKAATVYSRHLPTLCLTPHAAGGSETPAPRDPSLLASIAYVLDLSRIFPTSSSLFVTLSVGDVNTRIEAVPQVSGDD